MPIIVCHCGREVGYLFELYQKAKTDLPANTMMQSILDALGVFKPCCRIKITMALPREDVVV